MTTTHIITRSALLLAIALSVQSLRVIVPVPPLVSMIVIGTGINLVLLILAYRVSIKSAALVSAILPVMAFFQGQLPMIVFCPAVAVGNIIFVCLALKWRGKQTVWLAPPAKAVVLFTLSYLIVETIGLPPAAGQAILVMMGAGQAITAMIALIIEKKLEKIIFYRKNY